MARRGGVFRRGAVRPRRNQRRLPPATGVIAALVAAPEIDNARPLAAAKTTALTAGSEADNARPFATGKAYLLGRVGDMSTARPVTAAKNRTVGRPSETDTARPLAAAKTRALGRTFETDAARAVAEVNTSGLGQTFETDAARPVSPAKARAVAAAPESDTARSFGSAKTAVLGRVGETSGARVIRDDPGQLRRAPETDTARPLAAAKTKQLGRVGDVSSARPIIEVNTSGIGRVGETDTARALGPRSKTAPLGRVGETDAARPVGFGRLHPLGRVGETDAARPVTYGHAFQPARLGETDQARAVAAAKQIVLGRAGITSHARQLSGSQTTQFGRAGTGGGARPLQFVQAATGALNPSLWAVDPTTGALTPLPDFQKLTVSPIRNSVGAVTVDYPAAGDGFDLLAANVTDDRDLEVEIWLGGTSAGALRAILSQDSGDELDPDAVWTFSGHFLETLLDEAIVWTQPGDPKKELRFTAASPGSIVSTLLAQAQARGALLGMTTNATGTVDSNGALWPEVVSVKFSPGATYLSVLSRLVDLGLIEFEVTAGRQLRVYKPGGRGVDRTVGANPLRLHRGVNLTESPRRHSVRGSATAVLAAGAEGIYASASDAEALARRGRRVEASASASNLSDLGAVQAFAGRTLPTLTPGTNELTLGLAFGASHARPGLDFAVGDYCYADTAGVLDRLRVAQWSLTVDGQALSGTVSLNDLVTDWRIRAERRLNALKDGDVVIGTSTQSPGEDTVAPAAPTGITLGSTAYQVGAQDYASVTVGWTAPTLNADGTALFDLSGFRARYRFGDTSELEPSQRWVITPDVGAQAVTLQISDVQTGANIEVQVAAFDRDGNQSAWSASANHTTESDTTAPPAPSTPVVTPYLGQLRIAWDGLSSTGAAMPLDLDRVEVHVSTTNNFTPTTATLIDQFSTVAGERIATDLPYGATHYVRLRAVDMTGNVGSASAVGSATPSKVVSDDVFAGAIGTAQLAELAVTTAKINLLAVNDAQIGNLSVGKLTAGSLSATVLLTGLIRTATSGARFEADAAGIRLYNSAGTVMTRLQTSDGSALITGTLQSGLSGTRWVMEQDGTLRHYSSGFSGYSSMDSLNGDLIMRGRLDANSRSGRINANSIGVGLNFSSDAEIPNDLRSEIVLFDRQTRITAPMQVHVVDGRYSNPLGGARRVAWVQSDSSGTHISTSLIEYKMDAGSNGGMVGIGGDAGWKAEDAFLLVVSASMSQFRSIKATDFIVGSSAALKEDVDDARAVLDPLRVIREARARKYRYRDDKVILPPPTPEDPDPEPIPVEAPTRIGVLAEELPDVLVAAAPDSGGGAVASVSIASQVGVLWGAVGQILDQEIRSVAGRAPVPDGPMPAGQQIEIPIMWDETPLEVPTGGIVTTAAAVAWLGRTTARIKAGSLTEQGCTVIVRALSAVAPSAANPITVEAQALYTWVPPFAPEPVDA